jgi:hypothetical protein
MIKYEGLETFPSFRVERGEVKTQFDGVYGLIAIMHPYDIAIQLAESGHITQAFDALNGFLHREIDLKADAALGRLEDMRKKFDSA